MRNSRKVVLVDNVMAYLDKVPFTKTLFAQEVVVPPSGLTPLITPGRKCFHGVYIPANSPDPNRAEYCTECYPLDIFVKPNSVYLA